MTDAEMGQMTLADLEALAARFGKAVETIREAQALLGGRVLVGGQMIEFPNVHASAPVMPTRLPPSPPPPQLDPREVAERERLLRQFKHDKLSDAIKAAEKAPPP